MVTNNQCQRMESEIRKGKQERFLTSLIAKNIKNEQMTNLEKSIWDTIVYYKIADFEIK